MTSRKPEYSAAALAIAVGAYCFWSLPEAAAQDAPAKVSYTAAQADRGRAESGAQELPPDLEKLSQFVLEK